MVVISLVPRLPPAIDGLGDYAFLLAHQQHQDFGIQTNFIVGDPAWTAGSELGSFLVSQLSQRSAANLYALLAQQSTSTVILHYVGYGYAKRGCPGWLVKGLSEWKASSPKKRLITMFHEVAASGSPWTSAFWLSGLQHQLAKVISRTM